MDMESPRTRKGARAGKSIAADNTSPTKNRPNLQALDEVTSLRALHLMQAFSLRPELASVCAALAFPVQP